MVLPKDDNRQALPLTPSSTALARTVNSTLSSAQTITFNTATSYLRVYATSQDIYFKWGTTAATSSNFDEVVPAGQVIDLIIPLQTTGTKYTACTLIERNASAAVVVIEK